MFGNLIRLDKERQDILVEKLRNGDISKAGEEELICGHLLLGMKLVKTIARRYEILDSSDLEGVMALAITQAVQDGKQKLKDNEITKYIVKTVVYKIKTFIRKYQAAHRSERTIRHKLQKGINKDKISIKELETLEPEKAEIMKKLDPGRQYKLLNEAKTLSSDSLKEAVQTAIYESMHMPSKIPILTDQIEGQIGHIPISRETVRLELLEALKLSTQSPMDQAILDLRAEGYTYAEIGVKIGYSLVVVGEKLRAMEERFEMIWK